MIAAPLIEALRRGRSCRRARGAMSVCLDVSLRPRSSRRAVLRPSSSWSSSTSAGTSDAVSSPPVSFLSSGGSDARSSILMKYVTPILTSKVYDVCSETPLSFAPNCSGQIGNNVYLKREDLQEVFSFKIRGAYNKMINLSAEQRETGVVACSAGNHAQGVAMSCKFLKTRGVIVMPVATPKIKVESVKRLGGQHVTVVLKGDNYDDAYYEALSYVNEKGYALIHPFDDPHVIAGQGTIAMELVRQAANFDSLDAVFVCCGGGGMLSGIAAYIKAVKPEVKVIGVEAEDANGMTESLKMGKVTSLKNVGLFADGAAVRKIGDETFRVCNELVDGMVNVNTDEICNAIKISYNDARVVLEPAGALGVAGLIKYVKENGVSGKNLVAITSGANMDFDRLRFVSERSDYSERMISVRIPEREGSFRSLYNLIAPRNVTEFSYRYRSDSHATVIMSFQPLPSPPGDPSDFAVVMDRLRVEGYEANDLSDNDLAKDHAKHMVGGRAENIDERLFRFEFPESPGALKNFLVSEASKANWNWKVYE